MTGEGEMGGEEGVEELRRKTATGFSKKKIGSRKERFEMGGSEGNGEDGTMG